MTAPHSAAIERFAASMVIDYEKWHDGIGYDLSAIAAATPAERAAIEQLLVARGVRDWRDVEALAALGTDSAHAALRATLAGGERELVLAVLRHAPELADDATREARLVESIAEADVFSGLTAVLSQVEEFHPPRVVEAVLAATLTADATAAVHYAALLYYLAGAASEPFDMALRPKFLTFATPDGAARRAAYDELRRDLGDRLAQLLRAS